MHFGKIAKECDGAASGNVILHLHNGLYFFFNNKILVLISNPYDLSTPQSQAITTLDLCFLLNTEKGTEIKFKKAIPPIKN